MNRKRQKFGDMNAGTLFNDGRRSFIKISTHYPSGLNMQAFHRPETDKNAALPFNAIDNNGAPAKCPDWLEFELGTLQANVDKLI